MSAETGPRRTLERVAGGDPAALRQLRANVAAIGRQTENRDTRELVREVLAGRRGIDELTRDPEFERLGAQHLANLQRGLDELEPAEREKLLAISRPGSGQPLPERTPDAELDGLRDGAVPADGWRAEDNAPTEGGPRRPGS